MTESVAGLGGMTESVAGAPAGAGDRAAARLHVLWLVREIQAGLQMTAGDVQELVQAADRHGWPEVARAGLMLEVVRSKVADGRNSAAAVAQLLDRAAADRDLVMSAMGLAMGAQATSGRAPRSASASDQDLARAAVLLEGAPEATLELAGAHVECATAYDERNLWELVFEHYTAAENALRVDDGAELLLPAVRFNQAEANLNWLMALRELGASRAIERQAAFAAGALIDADIPALPDAWRDELHVFAQLISAITPTALDSRPLPLGAAAQGVYRGYVHLARALSLSDRHAALEQGQAAVSAIDPVLQCPAYNLALAVCAEIEQVLAGSPTTGLRYARHLARLRWQARTSTLASARSVRQAERLRSEHSILTQHVFLDDLTQLGNRRALMRHLEGLLARSVESAAIVLIDIDRFKQVNDRNGHAVGDETLIRVADVLRGAVRTGDLAVRMGGDEFLLVLGSTQLDVACQRAEEIRLQIAVEPWQRIGCAEPVTVSAGVAVGDPKRYDTILAAADAALYRSKDAGGDRVHAL